MQTNQLSSKSPAPHLRSSQKTRRAAPSSKSFLGLVGVFLLIIAAIKVAQIMSS